MENQLNTKPLSSLLERLDKEILAESKKNASIEIKALQLANNDLEKKSKN